MLPRHFCSSQFYSEGVATKFKESVAKYVELYCAEPEMGCVEEEMLLQTIHIISFNQQTQDDDATVFLPVGRSSFPRENIQKVEDDHQLVKIQQNFTVT